MAEGQYLDMVYYPKYKLGYIYDDAVQKTFKFNKKTMSFTVAMKGNLFLNQGKLLKKDPDQRLVVIRTGKCQLTVVKSLMNSPDYFQINVEKEEEEQIKEFQVFKLKERIKILVVTDTGGFYIYGKQRKEVKFLLENKIKIKLSSEEKVTCSNICSKNKYITASTKDAENKLFRLYVLSLEEDCKLKNRYIVDMRQADYAMKSESYFYEINMDFRLAGFPVLLCYQRLGEGLLVPLVLKKQVELMEAPIPYHGGLFGKTVSWEGWIWSVDTDGVLSKIGLSN